MAKIMPDWPDVIDGTLIPTEWAPIIGRLIGAYLHLNNSIEEMLRRVVPDLDEHDKLMGRLRLTGQRLSKLQSILKPLLDQPQRLEFAFIYCNLDAAISERNRFIHDRFFYAVGDGQTVEKLVLQERLRDGTLIDHPYTKLSLEQAVENSLDATRAFRFFFSIHFPEPWRHQSS